MKSRPDYLLETTLILLIMMLGMALRLTLLGHKSLWFDEAYSVAEAQLTQREIWISEPARTDSHPPLYYSGLHYWISLLGSSEVVVRLPSALVSVLGVALIYLLSRHLFGPPVALLAALLLAVSPLDLWYAQEARMYIFMAAILLLAAALQLRGSWWLLLPLALVLAAGFYTDYTMPLFWLALTACWIVYWLNRPQSPRPLLIWFSASLLALLLFWPWAPTFLAWLDRFSEVTFYLRVSELTGLPPLSAGQYLLLAVIATLAAIPLLSLVTRSANRGEFRLALTVLVLGGFLLINLLAVAPRFYSLKRLLVQIWPAVILLVAWLIMQTAHRRRVATVITLLSFAAAVMMLFFVQKDDWRGAVRAINQQNGPADVALLEHPWNKKVTDYYGLEPPIVGMGKVRERVESSELGSAWYLVERFPGQAAEEESLERLLDAALNRLDSFSFTRLEVQRYGLPAIE